MDRDTENEKACRDQVKGHVWGSYPDKHCDRGGKGKRERKIAGGLSDFVRRSCMKVSVMASAKMKIPATC